MSDRDRGAGPAARVAGALRACAPPLLLGLAAGVLAGIALRQALRPLSGLDARVTGDAVSVRTAPLTTAAHAASLLGRTWVLLGLAVVAGLVARRRCGPRAWSPLLAVLGAWCIQNAVKAIVQRPRPAVPHLEAVGSSSFPSGHAAQSAAFFLALVAVGSGATRRRTFPRVACATGATALVTAVAASRVYLGVHYLTDVVGGAVLGAGWGLLAVVVAHRTCSAPEPRAGL